MFSDIARLRRRMDALFREFDAGFNDPFFREPFPAIDDFFEPRLLPANQQQALPAQGSADGKTDAKHTGAPAAAAPAAGNTTAIQPQQQQQQQLGFFNNFGQIKPIHLDVIENANDYAIHADVPGIPKENVKLQVNDGVLTISGERKQESKVEEKNFRRIERSMGQVSRSLRLPKNADASKISASYADGVLHVTVPKAAAPASSTQNIQIK